MDTSIDATIIDKIPRKLIASMHNKIVWAQYEMEVDEQRLLWWLISQINPKKDDQFKKYKVPVSILSKVIGWDSDHGVHKRCRETTKRLMGRVVEIEDFENGKLIQMQFVIKSVYDLDEQINRGYVELQPHPDMRPYLLAVRKNFTKIDFEIGRKLTSKHAQRIYMIVKDGSLNGKRESMEVDYMELRKVLGIGDKKYVDFRDFRRRVLNASRDQISELTELNLTYQTKRRGRKVNKIIFYMTPKDDGMLEFESKDEKELHAALVEVGMTKKEAKRNLDKYFETDAERITWHLAELERLKRRGKKFTKGPLAWLRGGIKTDYRTKLTMWEEVAVDKERIVKEKRVASQGQISEFLGDAETRMREEG